jgi:hypothetical protein
VSALDLERDLALDALEVAPNAVLLVNSKLRVVFANAQGRKLLALADGLRLTKGVLCGSNELVTAALRDHVVEAACAVGAGAEISYATLTLPRLFARPPLSATVAPVPIHGLSLVGRPLVAALFLTDPEPGSGPARRGSGVADLDSTARQHPRRVGKAQGCVGSDSARAARREAASRGKPTA